MGMKRAIHIIILIIALFMLPLNLFAYGDDDSEENEVNDRNKKYINPHDIFDSDGKPDTKICTLCHEEMPEDPVPNDEDIEFESDFSTYCNDCHDKYITDHPVKVTHTGVSLEDSHNACREQAKAAKEDILNISDLPLIEERYDSIIFCGTCHLPHGKITDKDAGDDKDGIRRGFVICVSCHCYQGQKED